ncbi:MAG TPA: membrane dipeptidase [Geobacteraceae bacterium]|nr:membrane dipeptidase [Geobacteraceae bacterium]
MGKRHPYPAIDSHVDLLYDLIRRHPEIPLQELPDAWVSLPKLAEGGVRVIVSVFYCMDSYNGPLKAADNLRYLLEYAERNLQGLKTILTAEALAESYQGSEKPGGVRLLENADALLEFPPEDLKRMGFRVVGLTHFGSNRLCDGNAVPHPTGLTPAGRNLVRELERLGFAIDTAHLHDPGFRDVVDQFSGPLLSSHTGLRAFHDTPRNLSDEQVRTILSRGGVVGIAACPGILSAKGKADISQVFRQIDWLVQRYGPEGVGIGTDFGGYSTTCDRFEDHSLFPRLAELFEEAGYPVESIEGIMGGNWFRFFSSLLAGSSAEDDQT